MIVRVLGSAAGGGFPQWNCGCENCVGVRSGTLPARPRTQESIAVSADGEAWLLVNASPEVRQQLESFEQLWPRSLRDTPLAGIAITNGDLDHCLGLLSLRESQELMALATERVRADFMDANSFARTLQRFKGQLTWRRLRLGEPEAVAGLSVTALSVPGKPPLHVTREPEPEDNVGLRIQDPRTGAVLAYLSGVKGPSPELGFITQGASAVFFDGTFWTNDELIRLGISERTAADMAHWPLGGDTGSLEYLKRLDVPRRVLIHINNTNPVLREDSEERRAGRPPGVEIAFDGMELSV